jgi:hypothetical protein
MRRTGNDFDSPATGIEACGGAGMTKAVAFMERSQRVLEGKQACITRLNLIALEQSREKWMPVLRKEHAHDIFRAPGLERQIALR